MLYGSKQNQEQLVIPDFVFHKAESLRQFYDVKNKLGTGAFGEVYKCVHKKSG